MRAALLSATIALIAAITRPGFVAAEEVGTIVPGVQVGPVALGMLSKEAVHAAQAFDRATGCTIEILAAEGRVIAAGSRFGGCLALAVPRGIQPAMVRGPG